MAGSVSSLTGTKPQILTEFDLSALLAMLTYDRNSFFLNARTERSNPCIVAERYAQDIRNNNEMIESVSAGDERLKWHAK